MCNQTSHTRDHNIELTKIEKAILKDNKIKIKDIFLYTARELTNITNLKYSRCKVIIAYYQFQTLKSVGSSIAKDMIMLGYYTFKKLKNANPHKMYEQLTRKLDCYVDPCVEDVFRCAVAQINCPHLPPKYKLWWNWINQRGQSYVEIP
jgi:hypothetical protein